MEQVNIIGIDISKSSFQLHAATAGGEPVFQRKLPRGRFLAFMSKVAPCRVVMEACGGAHHWSRQIIGLGHSCELIPPVCVKPFLKRQKNDANDAAAIVEAVQRPTMRFVSVKSQEAQADADPIATNRHSPSKYSATQHRRLFPSGECRDDDDGRS